MPVFFDNSILRYSEVEKTLTYPRDWTENGVNKLSIWFRGVSDNAAETLYVVLNGSAVVNHDNPNAAQTGSWTEWSIPLQAFADQGVNLTNVNSITLGLGNRSNPVAGGSGMMYFDNIRLYAPAPEPLPIEVHVDVDDASSQVELEEGQILVVTLESNPTTGYRWEQVENQESILEQMGEAEFKLSETGEPPLVGAGGWEIFRFKAISAGQMTLQLVYHRSWEEGVEPLKTFSLKVVVR
jgi:inhibitor of cysteine peptidase